MIETVKNLYPHKKIQETPFPRISYKETMENTALTGRISRKIKTTKIYWLFAGLLIFRF